MQNLKIRINSQEDPEPSVYPRALSLFNTKISPFSPSKVSELSLSEEETSYLFKNFKLMQESNLRTKLQSRKCFEVDLSSIRSSPEKEVVKNIKELKGQISTLANKFSHHQEDIKSLEAENVYLKNRIITLQDNLINLSESSQQEKSKCTCYVF